MVHCTANCIMLYLCPTDLHGMLVTAQSERFLKSHLEGQWAAAKSFSAFHQYFIWQGIVGQGMKGTQTHIRSRF